MPPTGRSFDSDEEQPAVSSWRPLDLSPYLSGEYVPLQPGILYREDGIGLFYPGLVHWMHGEPESGKSWVGQLAAAGVFARGGRVLYVDHESGPDEVIGRFRALGVDTALIGKLLSYLRPEESSQVAHNGAALGEVLSTQYELAIIDGITDAFVVDGTTGSNDNDDVAEWMRRLPRRIAGRTGAAVVCIDHVPKNADSRGRFAIGGQAKMAGVDGAAYVVEPAEPLGRGKVGIIELRIAKDRPGSIRQHGVNYLRGDRTHKIARIVHDASDPQSIEVNIRVPEPIAGTDGEPPSSALAPLMERVSVFLEGAPLDWWSTGEIKRRVTGNAADLGKAVAALGRTGHVEHRTEGQSERYRSVSRYRRLGAENGGTPTRSPPKEGGTGGTGRVMPIPERVRNG